MHSCELLTNLRAKKVLCHRAKEAKDFRCCTTDFCFLNVIGGWKISPGSNPAEHHQIIFSQVGSGH